jgi:alpha-tubulin suppressor-like RCC1 family protein
LGLATLLGACRSDNVAAPVDPTPFVTHAIRCDVDAAISSIACAPVTPGGNAIILGGQNVYVRLSAQTPVYVAGVSFNFNANVQNLTTESMGSLSDGVTYDGIGVEVFFPLAPTNGVTINNATGVGTFIGSGEPYFQYPELVPANRTTAYKLWKFDLHGATNFTFQVYVSTRLTSGASSITIPAHEFDIISTGYDFSCGIRAGGAAYCWGFNGAGQFGDNKMVFLDSVPRGVLGGLLFTSIAAGKDHTCALDASGNAYCWGLNKYYALGVPTIDTTNTPVPVFGGFTFNQISTQFWTNCALRTGTGDRELRCWGHNDLGEVGNGGNLDVPSPALTSGGRLFSQVSSAAQHTCAVQASGAAYCWGYGFYGALGDGTFTTRNVPGIVPGFSFAEISAGASQTCGIEMTSRQIYCWGDNTHGQLGDGTTLTHAAPAPVLGGRSFATVATGAGSTVCGIEQGTGAAYCWGFNNHGQVGAGTGDQLSPIAVTGGILFAQIATGFGHTCASTSANVLYCWGFNGFGRLGINSQVDAASPTAVFVP